MTEPLSRLTAAGVAIWLDDISRLRLASGGLADLRDNQHVVGVTSNPTIFAAALSGSDHYDDQLHDLKVRGVTVDEAARMITTYDVRWACDVMRPVFDRSSGVDGRVSIEVDPRLAHQTDPTIAEARQLWWLVDRPNLFIKIPATMEGLPAITATLAQGISVNVTLMFSIERYRSVMDAWMTGLEQARANGHDLSTIESVASFFVSRVDTEVDKRLEKIGTPEAMELRGQAAVANARMAYGAHLDVLADERWQTLEAQGARVQRPLWASTGTKNPDYSDILYVDQLVAPHTVNTMPEKTLHAFADHGNVIGDTITPYLAQAREALAALAAVGVDYDDVVAELERDGVAKFETSWTELLATIETQLEAAR